MLPDEQLELELNDERRAIPYIPWGGRSPRSLTRSVKLFSFGAPPTGGLIRDCPLQLTLFLKGSPHGT